MLTGLKLLCRQGKSRGKAAEMLLGKLSVLKLYKVH